MNRRQFLEAGAGLLLGSLAPLAAGCGRRPAGRSLLFITLEDLSARNVGCYGHPLVRTPRLDAFAEGSVRFERAYCQAVGCNPSRSSFLTGLRPDSTGVHNNYDVMDERLPAGALSLPELFARAGASTVDVGKLFHLAHMARRQLAAFERIELGTLPPGYAGVSTGYRPPPGPEPPPRRFAFSSDPELERRTTLLRDERDRRLEELEPGSREWREAQVRFRELYSSLLGDSGETEEQSLDGQRARLAAQILGELARAGRPFLLAVGFERPHVPLLAPKAYVELYDPSQIPLPAPPPGGDRDIPPIALRFGRNYDLFPDGAPTPDQARRAIASYYACASFVDAQLGIVLDALDASGLAGDTVVVVLADHGFHLGEHGVWSKWTLFEPSTHVPLLVRVPGAAGNGRACGGIVELVDVLPTLCELFSLEEPQALEGTSFAPLLEDPGLPWKRAAFSSCRHARGFGRSLRTGRYRWSEWVRADGRDAELYDLEADPGEHVNRAGDPLEAGTARELGALLRAGWTAARGPAGGA